MIVDSASSSSSVKVGPGAQAGLLACGLFTTIGLFSPGLILPQMERAFASVPHAALLTQLVGAVASFAFALGSPVAGAMIARLGCRRVVLPSLILFAAAGTAPALLGDIWLILATRVLLGFALSGIFTGGLAGIGALPDDKRARMFGWYSVVGGSAAIALFPLIGILARFGWHLPFVVHLSALAVAPLIVLLPSALGRAVALADDNGADTERPLLNTAMAGLLVMAAVIGMSMFLAPMYAPLRLSALGVSDTRLLAIPVTLGSIGAVAASAAYGLLHRKLGVTGISAVMMIALAAGSLLAGMSTTIPLFTLAIVLSSAVIATLAPNISAAALAFSSPSRASQAIGLANGMMFGAQLLFPFLAAWVRGLAGIAGVFFAFGACQLAIGVPIAVMALAGRRRLAAV